ncbi:hypothetical protein [Mycobacteroides abscessus]|uniref:hypothetical protein n=1 Tax=Mycobacteroides abscessus TaxID=36809 RepID=UPI0002D5FDDD|nr:hypothetical protein [Mycobacteroides abscessus]QST89758.1 hypothetical protein PROPHIGD43A-3_25 [Mycobacterium phage prophiGD43A-3]QST90479.1 hypothetical protein PROPHIGD33-1_25 [Mycobacterium phage prophiGD33-1]MBN7436071.1 hypothetical protein [Mycobacteroides abscessus subsp. abscessus]MDO3122363.1 hypothetical protein [Mycobacteroides abscessus subsp. abscessus]MDO3171451.1 hypothetical protein [Mycobacteroides abscessus subsp. abscessus]
MSPMRHGDAERIAELCAEAGKPLQPWQHGLLQQIEQRDIDVQFAKMVRGFNC